MSITRENIEAFWIDHLEGSLPAEQVAELLLFLEKNPKIKAELEDVSEVTLDRASPPPAIDFKHLKAPHSPAEIDDLLAKKLEGDLTSEELKTIDDLIESNPAIRKDWSLISLTKLKVESESFGAQQDLKVPANVDYSNSENLTIGHVEGDLNKEQESAFESFSRENPGVSNDIAFYNLARVRPQSALVFANKSELKRSAKVVVFWPVVRMVAAAAAILAAVWVFWPSQSNISAMASKSKSELRVDFDLIEKAAEEPLQIENNQFADLKNEDESEQPFENRFADNKKQQIQKDKSVVYDQPKDAIALFTKEKKVLPKKVGDPTLKKIDKDEKIASPSDLLEIPQNEDVAVVGNPNNFETFDSPPEDALAMLDVVERKELTAKEYIGEVALNALGVKETKPSNIGWTLLDKAADKFSKPNDDGQASAVDVKKPGEENKGWKIKIGKLEIGRI